MTHTHSTHHALVSPLGAIVSAEHPPASPFPASGIADSEIILPKWIYIKDWDGRYLINRAGPRYSTLTFVAGEPNLDTTFKTVRTSPSWYQFIPSNKNFISRYYAGWYSSDSYDSPSYNIITAGRGNIVYLKDSYDQSLFFTNELNGAGAPVAHEYINESSQMEIVQAAIKNEIVDVQYDISGGKVREAASITALSTSLRNDSDAPVNQTLEYKYEKWAVGTWNNAAGIEIGIRASFNTGVPFVGNADHRINFSDPDAHEWGGQQGHKETVSTFATVTVPPKSKGHATIFVRNAHIDVGFAYTQKILWANGENEVIQQKGVYSNIDSWTIDVVLDKWEPVS